ncbi:hypothetical protein AAF712_002516 [Marasmius tenuissimus]|uniref:Uncharacterized protein n=1 Tax=Marasmius tenuissimus TaxID=585030 RepID=A0ABR3ABF3_9AGAR
MGSARTVNPNPPANPDYETTTPSFPAAQNQTQKSSVIGSVIGGVAFLVLLSLGVFLVLCRRRRRGQPRGGFQRDMMVSRTAELNGNAGGQIRKETLLGAERDRLPTVGPSSSTTPLQEAFERDRDDRSSISTSTEFCVTQGTRTPGASAISCTSTASLEKTPDVPILPLIPVLINPLQSLSQLTAPSRARTDRQMQIEQKIIELQGRYITASGSGEEKGRTRAELKERIEKAKELRESEWAYGGEGEVPSALLD